MNLPVFILLFISGLSAAHAEDYFLTASSSSGAKVFNFEAYAAAKPEQKNEAFVGSGVDRYVVDFISKQYYFIKNIWPEYMEKWKTPLLDQLTTTATAYVNPGDDANAISTRNFGKGLANELLWQRLDKVNNNKDVDNDSYQRALNYLYQMNDAANDFIAKPYFSKTYSLAKVIRATDEEDAGETAASNTRTSEKAVDAGQAKTVKSTQVSNDNYPGGNTGSDACVMMDFHKVMIIAAAAISMHDAI